MLDLATTMREMLNHQWLSARSRARKLGLFLMISLLFTPGHLSADQGTIPKPSYRLGVFPYLPALTIDRLYGPMADAFSMQLGRLVRLRTKSTFENFEDAIEGQSYDIIFVHPFFFVDAVDHHGYLPLARLDQELHAVLVANEDSDILMLDDLAGKTIGLPPKLAAVSKLIKSALMDDGVRPGLDIGIRHFRNKASCVQALVGGAVEACGVPAFILRELDSFANRPLRVVFEAPPVSHFAFAVHNRVPEEERRQLRDMVLSLGDGRIDGFGADKRFVTIDDADYKAIRAKTSRLKTLAQR